MGEASPLFATAPALGQASSFAVLGGPSITNTGATSVQGDVGVSPGASVTGFPPGTVANGAIHLNDALAMGAQAANASAYNNLLGQTCTQFLTGQDLGGMTLTAGVYCFASSAQLTGALILNATGNGVFVFKIGSTLTTASNASVAVTGGGSACNVFWQVGTSATLGPGTTFAGNILAAQSITLNTGASVSGRTLAQTGAVTLDTNNVGAAGCAVGVATATPTATPTVTATPSGTATPSVTATATATTSPTATATQTTVPSGGSGQASTATPTATGTATATDTPSAATQTAVTAATSTAITAANANAVTAATATTMAATASNNGVPSTSVSQTALPSASVATTLQPATQTAVNLATSTAITPAAGLAPATQTAVRGATATAVSSANAAATAVAARAPTQTTAPRGGGVPSELSLAILVAAALALSGGLAMRRHDRPDATVRDDSDPTA